MADVNTNVDENIENNTENNTEAKSSANKRVFLLDNLNLFDYDKRGYVTNLVIRKVPTNTAMVTVSKFNESKWEVLDTGFYLGLKPLTSVKLVRTDTMMADIVPMDCVTSENWKIPSVDFRASVVLTNPVLFEQKDRNKSNDQRVLYKLNDLFCTLIKQYTISKTYDDIKEKFSENFSINDLDPNGKLRQFETEYGVKVSSILFQNMEPPKEVKNAAQAKAEEDVAKIKRETAKRDSQNKADIIRTEGFAERDVKQGMAQVNVNAASGYMSAGMSSGDVSDMMKVMNAPQGSHIFIGAAGSHNNDQMQFAQNMALYNSMMQNGVQQQSSVQQNVNPVASNANVNRLMTAIKSTMNNLSPGSDEYSQCEFMLNDLQTNPHTIDYYKNANSSDVQRDIDYFNGLSNSKSHSR